MTGLRVAGLDLLLLGAGLGPLAAAGLVRSARDVLRLAGLAFLLGYAAVGALLTWSLVAGASLSTALVVGLAAAIAAPGLASLRDRGEEAAPTLPAGVRQPRVAVASGAVAVVYLAWVLRSVHAAGASDAWDAWGFWIPKARTIYWFGGLDTGIGGFTSFANPDYPPLLPALDAAVFRFAGSPDATLLPVQEWLLVVAFLAGAAGLLRGRVRLDVLAGSLLLVALVPDLAATIGASLGDLPLSLLLAAGALSLALFVRDGDRRLLVPAGIVLAGAALTKKEGLALALLLVAVAALARPSRRRLALLAPVAAAVVAAVLPWRLWLRANDVATSGDYRLRDLADPSYLGDRLGRLGTAAARVPQYLFDVGRWELVLPLALLSALLALGRARGVSLLVLVFTALAVAGLVAIYWISFLPLEFHLESSATRTVMPVVLVGAALLPLLLEAALYPRAASSER